MDQYVPPRAPPSLPSPPKAIESLYKRGGDSSSGPSSRGRPSSTSGPSSRGGIDKFASAAAAAHDKKASATSIHTSARDVAAILASAISAGIVEQRFAPPAEEERLAEKEDPKMEIDTKVEENMETEITANTSSVASPTSITGNASNAATVKTSHSGDNKSSAERNKDDMIDEARAMVHSLLEAIDSDSKSPVQNNNPRLAYSRNPMKAFSSSSAVTVEKFINSGGLRSVLAATRKHCASGDVVDFGCKALAAFAIFDNSSVDEMIVAGAIPGIIEALTTQVNGGHESANVSALKMLRNLTQASGNRETIFESGGMQAVIETMRARSDDARCNSHGALVLSNLAFGSQEIKESVGEFGGIAAISEAMLEHNDYQPMQARGSLALRNLCYGSEINQEVAGSSGVAVTLLKAIEGYMEDREVAHQSCIALANMSNINEKNRSRITEAGGAKIILELLKKFKSSATVNDDCISIIRNICVGNIVVAAEIGSLGGVESVVSAMQTFKTDSKMIEKACAALRYLCFVDENRKRVATNGGLEAIVLALKQNDTSEQAVENALLAIGNATFNSPDHKAILGRNGGIQVIIKAVEGQRLNEDIQEHGCRVLRNLADGFEFNRRIEAESGAINTAVFAMMGYPENASIQEQALALLLNLSMSESNLDKLKQSDVERLVEKSLSMHVKNRGVQLQGGQLLDRMNGLDYDDPATPKGRFSSPRRGNDASAASVGREGTESSSKAKKGFRMFSRKR